MTWWRHWWHRFNGHTADRAAQAQADLRAAKAATRRIERLAANVMGALSEDEFAQRVYRAFGRHT